MRGRWMRIERERRPELLSAVSNGRNVIIRRRRSRLEREKNNPTDIFGFISPSNHDSHICNPQKVPPTPE